MAAYKVPQDVEAEDKLIGPFSFRQFIYLIVAALGIFMAWLLAQIFIVLLVIPLPIVFGFLALALPLRKDQPMETYLIALVKFFFKPRRRLWDPEGTISLVQITAPKTSEGPQLKSFGGDEASERLSYLAQVVDTHGWSTRGATSASDNLSDIFVAEASHAEDVLDAKSNVAQAFDQRIAQSDENRMSAVRQQFQTAVQQPEPPTQTPPVSNQPTIDEPPSDLRYDPYPSSMHQHVVSPSGQPRPAAVPDPTQPATKKPPVQNASAETVSPDIIRLANNNDLSISAIASEARRLSDDDGSEVVISLR